MKQYLDLLANVLDEGDDKSDRTGTGTRSQFGRQMRIDLAQGFPLLTTKRVFWKAVVAELLWFIDGDTNARTLQDQGVTIWDEWAAPDGGLGPVYGAQWRRWGQWAGDPDGKPVDQLQAALETLQRDPDSRRIIVSAWNATDIPDMALAPCHCLFQFNTRLLTVGERFGLTPAAALPSQFWSGPDADRHEKLDRIGIPRRRLDLQLYQRSADIFLGVPFNIASYALLAHLVARHVGMAPGDFVHTFGDLHLYTNHFTQAETQLARRPTALPQLRFAEGAPTSIFEIRPEHILLDGYAPQAAIAAPVAV